MAIVNASCNGASDWCRYLLLTKNLLCLLFLRLPYFHETERNACQPPGMRTLNEASATNVHTSFDKFQRNVSPLSLAYARVYAFISLLHWERSIAAASFGPSDWRRHDTTRHAMIRQMTARHVGNGVKHTSSSLFSLSSIQQDKEERSNFVPDSHCIKQSVLNNSFIKMPTSSWNVPCARRLVLATPRSLSLASNARVDTSK